MKYQGCEGCCGNMVAGDGTTCGWCEGLGHHNRLFLVSVEVKDKTFTTTLWDVDGAYRYEPSKTGFSRILVVVVDGENWRWAFEPEFSEWQPLAATKEVNQV